MDSKLAHAGICKTKITQRHDLLCRTAANHIRLNGVDVVREVRYANEETNHARARPGDLDLWTQDGNKSTHWALDFAVVSEYHNTSKHFTTTASKSGRSETIRKEKEKIKKHRGSFKEMDVEFAPMVCSTSGAWGHESNRAFNDIAKNIAKCNLTSQRVERFKMRTTLTNNVMKSVARSYELIITFT